MQNAKFSALIFIYSLVVLNSKYKTCRLIVCRKIVFMLKLVKEKSNSKTESKKKGRY